MGNIINASEWRKGCEEINKRVRLPRKKSHKISELTEEQRASRCAQVYWAWHNKIDSGEIVIVGPHKFEVHRKKMGQDTPKVEDEGEEA